MPQTRCVLPLSCFSVGIAPVAFGFSGGLIFCVARAALFLGFGSCCFLGLGGGIGCNLLKGSTLLFFELYPRALGLPFVPGRSNSQTLFLPCKTGRFCGFLCDAVCVKASSFCIGRGAAAIGEIVVFFVFHDYAPLECCRFVTQTLLARA